MTLRLTLRSLQFQNASSLTTEWICFSLITGPVIESQCMPTGLLPLVFFFFTDC